MVGYVGWVQMNGITPSGVPGPGTAALHGCRLQSPATRCSAMVSNVTTLVCDIVPLWSGYIWLAQVGTIQHCTDMLTHPCPGRRHLRRVLDVPGDGAALPRALLRPPLPPDHARHQQEHCRQVAGIEEYVIRVIFANVLFIEDHSFTFTVHFSLFILLYNLFILILDLF